jgi:hypothetical protein
MASSSNGIQAAVFAGNRRRYLIRTTSTQAVDGLDTLYKDFRNRSIPVFRGLDRVLRSIAGEDVSELTCAHATERGRMLGAFRGDSRAGLGLVLLGTTCRLYDQPSFPARSHPIVSAPALHQ